MTQQECREKLKQNIVDTLHLEGVSVDDITDDMILFSEDGLGLDSLDAVELVVMLEKEFGVIISDSQQAKKVFISVAVLADFILAQKG